MTHNQTGSSLIEVAVALALSAFLTGSILTLFLGSLSAWRDASAARQAQAAALLASETIASDIRRSSHYGIQNAEVTEHLDHLLPEDVQIAFTVAVTAADRRSSGVDNFISYLLDRKTMRLERIVLTKEGGSITLAAKRTVAHNIRNVSVTIKGVEFNVSVEGRVGSRFASVRIAARPQNP